MPSRKVLHVQMMGCASALFMPARLPPVAVLRGGGAFRMQSSTANPLLEQQALPRFDESKPHPR